MAIGTLNEGSLHAALKQEFAEPGDRFEVPLERFVIDIVRDRSGRDPLLIEIQTAGFGAMGNKFDRLLGDYEFHLVHPIAVGTWIVREGMATRKSPKRGNVYSLFDELVSLPTLLDHPNLTLEIVLVEQEAHKVADPRARRGRGGWRTVDRRLRRIIERHRFDGAADLSRLVPDGLPSPFTTADLASACAVPRRQAQAMAYCLRSNGIFAEAGRTKSGIRYELT